MCGENGKMMDKLGISAGSPPRVRGKPASAAHRIACYGITPACAGKTCRFLLPSARYPDHPRMCGENRTASQHFLPVPGSPPRVRGKQRHPARQDADRGITPACAGKTSARRSCSALRRDHPRVCGENALNRNLCASREGSPPRVRGKRRSNLLDTRQDGITPACAGKTPKDWKSL